MDTKNKKDVIQGGEYSLPYHYIPEFNPNFVQHKVWRWGINYASTLELLLEKLAQLEFQSLVDIGCGDGRLVREVSQKFLQKNILGIDTSEKAIALAKALNPDLKFICGDITKGAVKQKNDIATLIEVFEHIPKHSCQSFVNSIHKIIKRHGYLLITVPHKNKALHTKHYQHFDKTSLLSYFKGNFEVVDLKYFEKQSLLSFFVKRVLINDLFILNNNYINNILYKIYKKYCFFADSDSCGRIFVMLKKV